MRISDWSSDVCSSDLGERLETGVGKQAKDRDCEAYAQPFPRIHGSLRKVASPAGLRCRRFGARPATSAMTIRARIASTLGKRRSEEHTSELQSLMRISYAVFCLKKTTEHSILY